MNTNALNPDLGYLKKVLLDLLAIPCPTGFTDRAVYYVCEQLEALGVDYELTRRGTIRANLPGSQPTMPDRAIVTHLDTIGAMVREIKPNGRIAITPIGHWSSRFAEGARVSIYGDHTTVRGSVLPLFAAGHAFNEAVDTQPVNWDQIEVRVDENIRNADQARAFGIEVGDIVAFDPSPEWLDNGYIVSRHLDNKAGTAVLLTSIKMALEMRITLPVSCHPIFTISEEVGSGAGHAIDDQMTEFVGIDIGPVAEGQSAQEQGVTVAMKDSSGPFDYHLTRHLIKLCKNNQIPYQRDVFRFYYSDAMSAVQAGHDIRHALLTFGTDATHGYERTHVSSLISLSKLLVCYMASSPAIAGDANESSRLTEFTHQLATEDITEQSTLLPNPKDVF